MKNKYPKGLSIAFLGALVPDTPEFQNLALRRSGNLVQDGMVSGFKKAGVKTEIFSVQPRASFPKIKKLFFRGKKIDYKGMTLHVVSFLNLVILKTLWASISQFFLILEWAWKNRGHKRVLLVYNTYTPPIGLVWFMAKITFSKSCAILYDLGMPPAELNMGKFKRLIYRIVELNAKTFIPLLDGRITINKAIGEDYGKNKEFIVIDGGISQEIKNRLFPLVTKQRNGQDTMTFFMGGSLSPINGTRIISEVLRLNKDPRIRIVIAGNGHDLDFVKEMERLEPKRVKYLGNLDLDNLFKVYSKIDVLLNLRILRPCDKYLFPSKILEYLAVGRPVITTNAGHLKEEYGDYCFVLSQNTPDALSEAMEKIMNQEFRECVDMGIRARNFMLAEHTWERKADKIIEYLKAI